MGSHHWILEKWIATISNPNFNIVQSMQDKFQKVLDEKFDEKFSQKLIDEEEQLQAQTHFSN